jgi:hypothetical protein
MNTKLTARSVRTLLSVSLVLLTFAAGAGFYFGLQKVNEAALEVTHASQDAVAGIAQVEGFKELQVQLDQAKLLVTKADTIFAPSANYQGQALLDLQAYATASGITITNTEFGDTTDNGANGAVTRPVTITLAQPVSYTGLLRFLQLTEGSLPKLAVNGVKITRLPDASNGQVGVAPITLRILVR